MYEKIDLLHNPRECQIKLNRVFTEGELKALYEIFPRGSVFTASKDAKYFKIPIWRNTGNVGAESAGDVPLDVKLGFDKFKNEALETLDPFANPNYKVGKLHEGYLYYYNFYKAEGRIYLKGMVDNLLEQSLKVALAKIDRGERENVAKAHNIAPAKNNVLREAFKTLDELDFASDTYHMKLLKFAEMPKEEREAKLREVIFNNKPLVNLCWYIVKSNIICNKPEALQYKQGYVYIEEDGAKVALNANPVKNIIFTVGNVRYTGDEFVSIGNVYNAKKEGFLPKNATVMLPNEISRSHFFELRKLEAEHNITYW